MKDFFKYRNHLDGILQEDTEADVVRKENEVKKNLAAAMKTLSAMSSSALHNKKYDKYIYALKDLVKLGVSMGFGSSTQNRDGHPLSMFFTKKFDLISCECLDDRSVKKGAIKKVEAMVKRGDYAEAIDAMKKTGWAMETAVDSNVSPPKTIPQSIVDKKMRSASMKNWPWKDVSELTGVKKITPQHKKTYAKLMKVINSCPATYTKDVKSSLINSYNYNDDMYGSWSNGQGYKLTDTFFKQNYAVSKSIEELETLRGQIVSVDATPNSNPDWKSEPPETISKIENFWQYSDFKDFDVIYEEVILLYNEMNDEDPEDEDYMQRAYYQAKDFMRNWNHNDNLDYTYESTHHKSFKVEILLIPDDNLMIEGDPILIYVTVNGQESRVMWVDHEFQNKYSWDMRDTDLIKIAQLMERKAWEKEPSMVKWIKGL